MSDVTTVGHYLVNDVMPVGHRVTGPITSKQLHGQLVALAKADPSKYVETIQRLKRRGDEIATHEGISVGLDDIEPDYEARDKILQNTETKLRSLSDPTARQKAIVDAQKELLDLTVKHPGSMTHMATSGARGNPAQLMKIIATPLVANDPKKGPGSFLIGRSYAEGLSPAEYWTTTPEARANNVATVVSVAKPGELAKVMVANLQSKVVTQSDCGTKAGVHLPADNANILDRYVADTSNGLPRNTLITPMIAQTLRAKNAKDVFVRSPMTCAAAQGVCQHCMGLDEKGQHRSIGINVGVRAAQAMTEPLTQMALSSKHAVLTIKEKTLEPSGFKGVLQLLEIPQNFQHEAALSPKTGLVTNVEAAPQGGHFVTVDTVKTYAGPNLTVVVKKGDHVESGDALTNGIPHPAKLVQHKGIGAGRQYFVNALDKVYRSEGVGLDRRHFELLAKTNMNTVRLLDVDDRHPEFLKGEPINYNAFHKAYSEKTSRKPLDEAVGELLGEEVFHHTVGTKITPSLVSELKARGLREIQVVLGAPRVEFVMKNFAMTPLMDKDWMGRLGHRYLKNSILQGVHQGEESDIHSTHPVPAYAYGAEIGRGPDGRY